MTPRPYRVSSALRTNREAGLGTLELLGIVVTAVILVTGIMVVQSSYPQKINKAFCEFGQAIGIAGPCESGETPVTADDPTQDEYYQPPECMLREESEQYSAEAKIWFITIGNNSGFIVQEFSDGTVRATVTDGASLGGEYNMGTKIFDTDKLGVGEKSGLDVKLGGDLTMEYGDTWEFDSIEEWESLREDLDDYLIDQMTLKQPGGWAAFLFRDIAEEPKDRDVSFAKLEFSGHGKGEYGIQIPNGVDDAGDDKFFDPNVGVRLEGKAGTGIIFENNHAKDEKSWTYEVSAEGDAGGDVVFAHGDATGAIEGAVTITRDSDDELTEIQFKTMREGGFESGLGNDSFDEVKGGKDVSETSSTVTTMTLDVTDENRDLAEEWLGYAGQQSEDAGIEIPLSAVVPEESSDDPFEQMLYDEAKTSQVKYENIKDEWAFEMGVKKGWNLGFAISGEEATAEAVESEFLGAPDSDGQRPMVPDTECVSE